MPFNENPMADNNYRRRDVLRATMAASVPMATGVASAQQSDSEGDVGITNTTGVSPEQLEADVRTVATHAGATTLASRIEDETGFTLDEELAVGVDLETDDKELNAHDPRILYLPLSPSGSSGISTGEPTQETRSSSSGSSSNRRRVVEPRRETPQETTQAEFSIDNGGVLLSLTVRANGERIPAALMGMTRETSRSNSVRASSSGSVDTKSFVVEDGSARIHRERSGQRLSNSTGYAEIAPSAGTVTPADTDFTCWGCATVVGIACAGAATLSYGTCVQAAFASSVFSPWAFAAVGAFCTYIVANAGTLSCAVGAAGICAGVTDDCDFLE